MNVDFSLITLRIRKEKLIEIKDSIESGDGLWHIINPEKELIKLKHQIADLDFSIEVLETYQD